MTQILKAAQVRARAEELDLSRASDEALRAELERVRDEAFAAGRQAGRSEALAEGIAAATRVAEALGSLAHTAAAHHSFAVVESGDAMLSAAVEIAEWLVRAHLSETSEAAVSRLKEIARSIVITGPSTVYVSGSDLSAVTEWAQSHGTLEVAVDAALDAGEVRLTTRSGEAQFLVADALTRAAQALGVSQP